MSLKFCLDMDGPCTRFIHAALKVLGKENLIDNYPVGASHLEQVTGIPYEIMFQIIDAHGSEFWRNLEETPSFWELYNGLKEMGEVVFCTSPSLDPNSLKGKVEWMQDRFGRHFRNYIITNKKYFCADENTVLIDDTLEMCLNFKKAGGLVVQYPTRLNGLDKVCSEEDRAKYVLKKIKDKKWM